MSALRLSALASFAFILAGCAGMQMARLQHEARMYHATLKSPLKPYLLCGTGDGLSVAALNGQSPGMAPYRLVSVNGQVDTISVAEGYRSMFSYMDQDYFFANVKFETSRPERYESDKAKLTAMLQSLGMGDTVPPPSVFLDFGSMHGFPVYGSEVTEIDKTNTMGIYLVFSDAGKVVVSAYLLNQGKKNRRFNNLEEYRALRDGFLERMTACMEKADAEGAASADL